MNARFVRCVTESEDVRTFWFRPERMICYDAGQFVELRLQNLQLPPDQQARWFTLSSSPTEKLLSITTRIPAEPSAFKASLLGLRSGDSADMSEPLGDFILPIDTSRRLIFVAGGIGITPFRSMLKYLKDINKVRDIQLIYAANSDKDLAFVSDISKSQVVVTYALSEPSKLADSVSEPLSASLITRLASPTSDDLIYISGSPKMVESLSASLISLGIKDYCLVTDSFLGY